MMIDISLISSIICLVYDYGWTIPFTHHSLANLSVFVVVCRQKSSFSSRCLLIDETLYSTGSHYYSDSIQA